MSKKSLIANIEEKFLGLRKLKFMESKEAAKEFLDKQSKNPNKSPKSIFKSIDFNGMKIFAYGNEKKAKKIILFIHGGAYVGEINIQHHLFCRKLSRKTGAYVLSPVYPLAPNHKAMETFELITDLYKHVLEEYADITLMGDSAGGGFVLSFCQYLNTINLPQPEHIVAISPWVDISMSNPPYDNEHDCILNEIGLKEVGKSWAGNLDTKDYRVSPLFGDTTNLADTLITAGTGEIFYQDIKKYVEKQENVKFITAEGMFHIYPLFPSPEANKAFKEIKKEIMS